MELKYVTTRAPTTSCIKHYSSSYYDPIKAHQYYEEHKKLKGNSRVSTPSLNETGQKASSYVKSRIDEERNKKLEEKNKKDSEELKTLNTSHAKYVMEQTKAVRDKISSLNRNFSKLNAAQKRILGPRIKAELNVLKNRNEQERFKLNKELEEKTKKLKEDQSKSSKAIREEYDAKYQSELKSMLNDSSMVKQTQSKKSSTKTSSKSSKSSKQTKSIDSQIAEKFAAWNSKHK